MITFTVAILTIATIFLSLIFCWQEFKINKEMAKIKAAHKEHLNLLVKEAYRKFLDG